MKTNSSLLVVVAMVVGALGATGCKSADKISDKGNDVAAADTAAATPEDNPDTAPVSNDAAPAATAVEQDARFYTYWAPRAPPALRVETHGVGPAGHFWRPGYYGWSGREHVWHGGGWYAPRAGYEYANPGWHHVGNRWGYYPGRWYRH